MTTSLWLGPGQHELPDLVQGRKPAARSESAAIQRRHGVREAQDILDISVREAETAGGEGAAKGIAPEATLKSSPYTLARAAGARST